jgi:hypothetical protein
MGMLALVVISVICPPVGLAIVIAWALGEMWRKPKG